VPTGAFGFRRAAAQAGGGDELAFRLVALEDLADLEQRDIADSRGRHWPARRGSSPTSSVGPHVGEIGRDRVGEHQLGWPPPNSLACAWR
jgi:hypothetical protein